MSASEQILLRTCAFTASGWQGVFYPKGMKSADYLTFYSQRFETVEVDSTFYGCPRPPMKADISTLHKPDILTLQRHEKSLN